MTLGQQNFKWTLRSGGEGSDLNVQLTLSGEKVNMSTALTGVTTIISLILFSPGGNGNEKP